MAVKRAAAELNKLENSSSRNSQVTYDKLSLYRVQFVRAFQSIQHNNFEKHTDLLKDTSWKCQSRFQNMDNLDVLSTPHSVDYKSVYVNYKWNSLT